MDIGPGGARNRKFTEGLDVAAPAGVRCDLLLLIKTALKSCTIHGAVFHMGFCRVVLPNRAKVASSLTALEPFSTQPQADTVTDILKKVVDEPMYGRALSDRDSAPEQDLDR
jgi:hypothetical protein